MNLLLFYLVVVLFAVIVLCALFRNRDVKAMCRLPFISFSFEAKEPDLNRPTAEEKPKSVQVRTP